MLNKQIKRFEKKNIIVFFCKKQIPKFVFLYWLPKPESDKGTSKGRVNEIVLSNNPFNYNKRCALSYLLN